MNAFLMNGVPGDVPFHICIDGLTDTVSDQELWRHHFGNLTPAELLQRASSRYFEPMPWLAEDEEYVYQELKDMGHSPRDGEDPSVVDRLKAYARSNRQGVS